MTRTTRLLLTGAAAGLGGYGVYVASTWLRYGRPSAPAPAERDDLLERFMPIYDIVERHHVSVPASPDVALAAACDQELSRLPIIRTIFRARELLLGSQVDTAERPRGLLAETTALGWVVLAGVPGREVVVGAVTRPWEADVRFRGIPAGEFAAFDEPGYVKIVWTLRADPAGDKNSIFRTETRAVATDAEARRRFRRYWSFLSPGIVGIRRVSAAFLLSELRTKAETNSERPLQPT